MLSIYEYVVIPATTNSNPLLREMLSSVTLVILKIVIGVDSGGKAEVHNEPIYTMGEALMMHSNFFMMGDFHNIAVTMLHGKT